MRLTRLSQESSIDRAGALERIRGKHISTFDLLDDDEYAAGLERAERELPERVDYRLEWLARSRRPDSPCRSAEPIRTPLTRSREAEKES